MMGMITFFTVLFLSMTGITAEMMADGECDLIQYLNIGENGIIQCSFETFLGLSWYNTDKNRGILFFKDGAKTGEGYERGEYDIFSNGSLLVRNVTLDHDGFFSVTKVIAAVDAITVKYDIQVKTVVKPTSSYPIIDECADGTPSCLISANSDGYIRCHIDKSRPPVNLTWIEKKHGTDRILPSNYSSSPHDNITFVSQTSVSYSVSQLSLLNMFICQVSSIPKDLVSTQESVILLEKGFDFAESVTPGVVHFEVNLDVMLLCSGRTIGGIVWKQLLNGKDSWSTILYTIPPPNNFTEYYLVGFDVDSEGALLLRSIKTEHEGLYACIHQDDRQEDISLYDVKVYVNPVPPYPAVEGCNHQQYCVLHVTDGDFLNCSIFGIRPEVNLEWMELQDRGQVLFEDQSHSVEQTEDRFDVILSSRVSFSPSVRNRVTVECTVTGPDSQLFDLSTTMDLVFENGPVSNQPALATLVIILIVAVAIVAVSFIILLLRRRATQGERPRQALNGEEDGERYPMMPGVNESYKPTSEKVKIFITQLKTKYTLLYNSVQSIKDRKLCVDQVYVEGGIELLTDVTRLTWKSLASYRELLKPTCLDSKRQIIEGEPCYGKSTLILQLVYDWRNNIPSSPLGAVHIVIYLRLRQLSGVTSMTTAIKRFILPKDTPLSEEDINEILGKSSHILLLLDGYDEYPDQNNPESFVHHILKKELFQDADVILTTRSSCLPKKVTPTTSRVRLTGFNEESRDTYIIKAVTGGNRKAAAKIKRKLSENPVLGDLCDIPLLFVMFAHMAHEREDLISFKTVTSFFISMIQCFHIHVKNKMDDENVAHFHVFENDHKILGKIAFDSLNRQNQKKMWKRGELTEKLGKEVYDQYVRIGTLVEKKIHEVIDETEPLLSHRDKWEVRFYHKLFCEWYAAHHLSDSLRNTDYDNYDEFFKYLDPYDLQYLYLFASGIDENAYRKIIKHFQSTDKNQMFAILCMFEEKSNHEVVLEKIRHMVSANSVSIKLEDTKLLQRSTIRILDLASKHEISISCVTLDQSFDKVENNEIRLRSGLILPKLLTLEKMDIETEDDRELTEDDVMKIFTYELQSQRLQEISFGRCLLPLSYPLNSLFPHMIKRDVAVSWCRYGYRLDFNSRIWRVENVDTVKSLCSNVVHIRKDDSDLQQNCTIELLKNASKHNISISCVSLDRCFDKVDENKIKLKSGLTLPILLTQEKIHIQTEKNRELTEEDVNKIFTYGLESQRLQEISFDGCLLPLSISVSGDMIDRHINVSWCRYGYGLNLKSGLWRVENVGALERLCSKDVKVWKNQCESKRNCSIELLKNASHHNIPISSVRIKDYSPKMDESGLNLTLHPGVSLPIMNSLQVLWINDNSRLSNEDFAGILYYCSQCTSLKELRFISDKLPTTVPLESIPAPLISRNVEGSHERYSHIAQFSYSFTNIYQACNQG